jgi:DNA mismatch repair protein MutL
MNAPIRLLPESLINQIAAGEVVERPASVVKELLENSVDAGASDIQIDVIQSGKSSIRVTDNGRGMTKEDLLLAIERHATSKIREYADLMALKSMGFRGEALPSIAAVSRMTLSSIPRGGVSGHRLEIWGGKKIGLEEIGGGSGTVVEVMDLFYNTPARMAFLKSPRAEWTQIQIALERVALGFPSIRFEMTHNGKKILQLFPSPDKILRLQEIWGPERTNALIPVDLTEDRIRIAGFISPPHLHQNTSRHMAFVVNQRWVRSPLLYPLILRAYAGMIPSGRFPTIALWMEVPPELIDVNIHPTKQEVRFSQTSWIQTLVGKALGQALKSHVPKTSWTEKEFPQPTWSPGQTQPSLFKDSGFENFYPASTGVKDLMPLSSGGVPKVLLQDQAIEQIFDKPPDGQFEAYQEGGFSRLTLITQLQGTYLLGLLERGLILIDQHAAHERILYEQYLSQWKTGRVSSQYLIVPILIEQPPGRGSELESIQSELGVLGFEITSAGGSSLWVKSLPVGIRIGQAEEVLKEILEEMRSEGGLSSQEAGPKSLLRLLACHSAIRAGQVLTPEEIKSLLIQLDQTESPSHCPHGRPLWILISWEEIEKRFKRR